MTLDFDTFWYLVTLAVMNAPLNVEFIVTMFTGRVSENLLGNTRKRYTHLTI